MRRWWFCGSCGLFAFCDGGVGGAGAAGGSNFGLSGSVAGADGALGGNNNGLSGSATGGTGDGIAGDAVGASACFDIQHV